MLGYDRQKIKELCEQWCKDNGLEPTVENYFIAADCLGFLGAAQQSGDVTLERCKAAIMEYWRTGNLELLQEVGCDIRSEGVTNA